MQCLDLYLRLKISHFKKFADERLGFLLRTLNYGINRLNFDAFTYHYLIISYFWRKKYMICCHICLRVTLLEVQYCFMKYIMLHAKSE